MQRKRLLLIIETSKGKRGGHRGVKHFLSASPASSKAFVISWNQIKTEHNKAFQRSLEEQLKKCP